MKSCIVYGRISTDQEKQNIKQQIEYCKKWAIREGYKVIKTFKDIKTGKTDQRRGYQRMLKYLAENPGITLIVQDTDRLTRDFYDGVYLEVFIIEKDINLISLSENIDLRNPNGRFMWRIRLAMNCFYVENLTEKIKIGVERAKKEGKYKGRKAGTRNKKTLVKLNKLEEIKMDNEEKPEEQPEDEQKLEEPEQSNSQVEEESLLGPSIIGSDIKLI